MTDTSNIVHLSLRASVIAGELQRDSAMCALDSAIEELRVLGHQTWETPAQCTLARALEAELTSLRDRFAVPMIASLATKAAEFETAFRNAADAEATGGVG